MSENGIERDDADDSSVSLQSGVATHISKREDTGGYGIEYVNVPVSLRDYLHDADRGKPQIAIHDSLMEQFK
ncbi:hypothetical protein [Bifidobacterium favimelis]|uniref:Uncharacterized protein n=1 Tax=Bifidobacterium favimelis TaxID=3122979 RepID=A0ABU8ZML0_9BIFI